MSTIINATTTNGVVIQPDNSGSLQLATNNGITAVTIDTSQNLQFNSGYGSVATAYGCRAWVNFNGTGTVAIRASGNVTSITDNGTGDYTVNFTTALSNANYCAVAMSDRSNSGGASLAVETATAPTTTALKLRNWSDAGVLVDALYANVAIFR